ncbi:MAG: sugar ABC transporter substrate-binding protein [Candidatus Limnocylindrales bacterium]
MNRLNLKLIAAAATVAVAGAAFAVPVAAQEMDKTACLLAPAADTPYSSRINAQIQEYGAENGIDVTVLSAEGDLQAQVDQFRDCLARPVDGIMLIAVDALGVGPVLQEAADAGVPVLAVNSGVDASLQPLTEGFTGPDYVLQAEILADYTCDTLLPDGGNVAIVTGALGYSATIERTDGYVNRIAEACPDQVTIIDQQPGDWSQQRSLEVARDLVTKHGDDLDMIYAEDDTMAAGVAEGLAQADASDVILVGVGGNQDGFRLMGEDAMAATVYQSPVIDGTLAVDTLLQVFEGVDIPDRTPIDSPVITPENMSEFEPAY